MDIDLALKLVRALADGHDPHTGEELSIAGPYQQPDVIRALFRAVRALEREAWREQRLKAMPGNTGKPWQADEDQMLIERFTQGHNVEALAALHQRTSNGIRERLVRLGKLAPSH
jgi:hypothetical protein